MKFQLQAQEKEIFDIVKQAAQKLGFPAFVIGGFIRDRLLNRPSKDIDIVCLGDGITLAEEVAKSLSPTPKVSVFKTFGTAMLKYHKMEIEFVGARKESYLEHSRKPTVEAGSIEDDQNRRDFTINALAVSLNNDFFGEIIDPFGGVQHLQEKIIKTPLEPGITFSDDPLRMMRAIRFSSQLGFEIEKQTFEAIKQNKERIHIVSKERITVELDKILLSPKPSIGLDQLYTSGLLELIFPELVALRGVEYIDGKGHKDNFYHTLEVIDNLRLNTSNLWLLWSAVLHDIAKPATKKFLPETGWTFHGHEHLGAAMVPRIFRKLKLPQDNKMKYVQKLVSLHLRPISLTKENITDSAIRRLLFDAGDELEDLMLLCSADITSKNADKKARYLENYQLVKRKLEEVEEKDRIRNWQPPITGELIMETFHLKPCKEVGEIKNAIKEAILEGEIPNEYEEAFQLMLKKGIELGLIQIFKT